MSVHTGLGFSNHQACMTTLRNLTTLWRDHLYFTVNLTKPFFYSNKNITLLYDYFIISISFLDRQNASGFVIVSSWSRHGFNKSAWVAPTARSTYLYQPRSKSAASKPMPFLPPNFSPGCQARVSSIPSNNKKQLEPPLYGPLTKPNAMLRHSHVNINTTLKEVGGMA